MMQIRPINLHQVPGAEFEAQIIAVNKGDHPSTNHYTICLGEPGNAQHLLAALHFQQGHPSVFGRNGITLEELIAVCMDRLQGFQRGPFANAYNDAALKHLELAIESLKDRTREIQHLTPCDQGESHVEDQPPVSPEQPAIQAATGAGHPAAAERRESAGAQAD